MWVYLNIPIFCKMLIVSDAVPNLIQSLMSLFLSLSLSRSLLSLHRETVDAER